MKRVKFALAGVALVTAALTMSFSSSNNDVKDSAQQNDCWTSPLLHQMEEEPDESTENCPRLSAGCCVKPDPNNPGQYIQFARN